MPGGAVPVTEPEFGVTGPRPPAGRHHGELHTEPLRPDHEQLDGSRRQRAAVRPPVGPAPGDRAGQLHAARPGRMLLQLERRQHAVVRETDDAARPPGRREGDRAVVQDRPAAQQYVAPVGVGVTAAAGPVGEQLHTAIVDQPPPRLDVARRRCARSEVQHALQLGGVGERGGHVSHLLCCW
ncbi:hypothetical protein BRW64_06490 [Mycolicibacterium diernhoferi]|nr:hypothetical protein BRW64_06490 [Mycolicibacterium diernhoferi]